MMQSHVEVLTFPLLFNLLVPSYSEYVTLLPAAVGAIDSNVMKCNNLGLGCDLKTFDLEERSKLLRGKTILSAKLNISVLAPSADNEINSSQIDKCLEWRNHFSLRTLTENDNSSQTIRYSSLTSIRNRSYQSNSYDGAACSYVTVIVEVTNVVNYNVRSHYKPRVNFQTTLISTETDKKLTENGSITANELRVSINALDLTIEDGSCDFKRYCRWRYNKTDVKINNHEGYGSIKQNVVGTTLTSPFIMGSSRACRLRFNLSRVKSVLVSIISGNTTKILMDTEVTGRDALGQGYNVTIGEIRGPFQMSIYICKRMILQTVGIIRDIVFDSCGGELDTDKPACDVSEFQCSTGHCISRDMMCDTRNDCLFGDDEALSVCDYGDSNKNYMCAFENELCDWKAEKDYGSQCYFRKADLIQYKTSECARQSGMILQNNDNGLMLLGSSCRNNETGNLVSWLFPYLPEHTACQIRFSYYLEDMGYIQLVRCDENQECHKIWQNDFLSLKGPNWYRVVKTIPPSTKGFYLHFITRIFMQRNIAIDMVSFSSGCVPQNTSIPDQYVNTSSPAFTASVKEADEDSILLTVVGAAIGSVVGIVTAVIIFTVYRRRHNVHLTDICRKSSAQSFSTTTTVIDEKTVLPIDGSYDSDDSVGRRSNNSSPESLAVSTISPYYEWLEQSDNTIRNIPRKKIKLTKLIGKGAFGEVYFGLLADVAHLQRDLPVAVKTLPSLCSEQTKSEFFFEAMTLSKFKHPNIVRFLGISVEGRSMFLVLELMEGGDVKSFVREARPRENSTSILTIKDLLKLSCDISKGCQYLERNKFIHRDIAARNCLLNEKGPHRVAKIGDFGMARDIFRTNYYRKNGVAMVPVKWMPPESFMDGVFSSKTDVWAFGVTLWEVFSMGHIPYPGKSNAEVMKYVTSGGRLNQPTLCPDEIFELMGKCWEAKSHHRPDFTDIVDFLSNTHAKEILESFITYEDFTEKADVVVTEQCSMLQS